MPRNLEKRGVAPKSNNFLEFWLDLAQTQVYAPLERGVRGLSPQMSREQSTSEETFRTRDVVQMLAISRRRLQYWAQTDLVRPSAQTPGGHSRYSFEDLVALKATKRLIDSGVSVQRIRSSIRALRRILPTVQRPLAELVLVATGDVVLAFRDGTAFDAISGQEWVFEVAQFEREIEAWKRSAEERARIPASRPVRRARVGTRTA